MFKRATILIVLGISAFSFRSWGAFTISKGYAKLTGAYVLQRGQKKIVINPNKRNYHTLHVTDILDSYTKKISFLNTNTLVEICGVILPVDEANSKFEIISIRPLSPIENIQYYSEITSSPSKEICDKR